MKESVYLRLRTYKLEEVLPLVQIRNRDASGQKVSKTLMEGKRVRLNSLRLRTFFLKGTSCATCGHKGTFFALERHIILCHGQGEDSWHLNLYGLNEHGHEIMLTRDHIKPLAKGGNDNMENSQTLCLPCNKTKADKWNGQ